MHGPLDAEEVRWSREGDAWVGVLGARGDPGWDAGAIREDAFEVEVLLRAEDWHVEVSHAASGGFERRLRAAARAGGRRRGGEGEGGRPAARLPGRDGGGRGRRALRPAAPPPGVRRSRRAGRAPAAAAADGAATGRRG